MTAAESTTSDSGFQVPAQLFNEAAAATGIGSMPGTSVREATAVIFGESDLPYVPELPGRGPGSDMIGRTMSRLALVDPAFSVSTTPSGWRLADRPGRDVRRALSWWGEDLDAVQEQAVGFAGSLKVQLAGPLTVAASVELVSGEKVLRDQGARRDIGAATAEAAAVLVADLRGRVPQAHVIVQLDEPGLAAVINGSVPTASGLTKYRPVELAEVESLLSDLVKSLHGVGASVLVHSCAPKPPFELWRRAGFDGISFDAALITDADYDHLGAAIDRGTKLVLGVVPTNARPDSQAALAQVSHLQRELSFDDATWLPNIAVSPSCGLATLPQSVARASIDAVHEVARSLRGVTASSDRDSA
jgi:methionine synthase II (cobalamin-independent)